LRQIILKGLIDGQVLGRSLFLLKTGFWPSYTAKSQPIWIKFCTHPLLYGVHLRADLDRDRRVGSSRPNHNVYVFFVILVTHPKSYIETTDRRDFGGKPSKWKCGWVLSGKISDFFCVLGYPSTILRTAYRNQFSPNQW